MSVEDAMNKALSKWTGLALGGAGRHAAYEQALHGQEQNSFQVVTNA